MSDGKIFTKEQIIEALCRAFLNASLKDHGPKFSGGHRSGVRDVAVRLGLYDEFLKKLPPDMG